MLIEDESIAGLPKPGTLEHTVKLGFFKLQQGINQFASKLFQPESLLTDVGQYGYSLLTGQPVADDKIGTAAAADSVTYSSLTSVNPTNVALGVLATGQSFKNIRVHCSLLLPSNTFLQIFGTLFCIKMAKSISFNVSGALGSVVYSALTSGNLATSAASLATGAVSAIRRNDLVVAASDMLGIDDDPDPSQVTWVYDYYTDYDADYRYKEQI